MGQISYVVVFPTIFSKRVIPQLISNIKKILEIKDQSFKSVKRDGDIILVDASDPVLASSAINLLFGIKKISITRQVDNNFKDIISEIVSIGGNLLLKGEKFLVKVDGVSKGFLPKDVELAATSEIIEKKSHLGAKPGTEQNYDKLLDCHLTKKKAYISIFSDEGIGGIPFKMEDTICCIYDELSAISCYETMKQGFNPRIVICYKKRSELIRLAKIINKILPRMLKREVTIEIFHIKRNQISVSVILEILLYCAKLHNISHVSIPVSYLTFPVEFVDDIINKIFESKKIPILPISGYDLFTDARELGLNIKIKKQPTQLDSINDIIKSRQEITIKIGPNNVHDLLDSLEFKQA